MSAVSEFLELCRGSTLEEFCGEHPHPCLLHDVTARPFTPVRRRSETLERLTIGPQPVAPPPAAHATVSHLAGLTPTEQPAPAIGDAFQVFVLRPQTANAPQISIGSDVGCDVQIGDASISALHAYVERRGSTFLLRDNDSTAGTQVNDRRVEPASPRPLSTGDRVTLGYIDFTFLPPPDFYLFVRRLYGI